MGTNSNLNKISTNVYEIPKTDKMKVAARIYASEKLLPQLTEDQSIQQLKNAAQIPSVVEPVIGMPDMHQGFGLPIGGVMATEGYISAGAVGMDINCGVRLLATTEFYKQNHYNQQRLKTLMSRIEARIPVGLGAEHNKIQKGLSLRDVVLQGCPYLMNRGYARKEDVEHTEENGYLEDARWDTVTKKARSRGEAQLGTLGSGNHFIELQKVVDVFDSGTANAFGLYKDQLCFMIHSGSRALGHQTCVDYSKIFWRVRNKYKIKDIPNSKLAALPWEAEEAQDYYGAMSAAVNFAFANRQIIAHEVRRVFKDFVQEKFKRKSEVNQVYDVAHNIAKWEKWKAAKRKWSNLDQGPTSIKVGPSAEEPAQKQTNLLIHRKGATRALPPNHPHNPTTYRKTGHPALIPGSMGTGSYVVVGTEKIGETFGSVNHGAGRTMSRRQAKKSIKEKQFKNKMGNIVYNLPFYKIADEAPQAYKDIDEVVKTLVDAGLTKAVVRLEPLMVIKGD